MEREAIARIISWNIENEIICASAARISTTIGTALEILDSSLDLQKNRNLISRVLSSGHASIIEHAVFTIAMENVSAFTEEFFIEHRLASFTVKSRRYVDFSNLGYYIPKELTGHSLQLYCRYMDNLFSAYNEMLEKNVPKEDARFLLPYSFNSNFYCTMNARELIHTLTEMKHGRFADIPELSELADQILKQTESLFPIINQLVARSAAVKISPAVKKNPQMFRKLEIIPEEYAGTVSILQAPINAEDILQFALECYDPFENSRKTVTDLLYSSRSRELEQLSYTFSVKDISLSGITHIVRHRMQSLIVPPLTAINFHKMILPKTIASDSKLLQRYQTILADAFSLRFELGIDPVLQKYTYYFLLSGNTTDIMTTINAKELIHLIRLRSCNRAQWEIRNIVIRMLELARNNFPTLFQKVGPNCYMYGNCPEKRLSCGKQCEVVKAFSV